MRPVSPPAFVPPETVSPPSFDDRSSPSRTETTITHDVGWSLEIISAGLTSSRGAVLMSLYLPALNADIGTLPHDGLDFRLSKWMLAIVPTNELSSHGDMKAFLSPAD